MIGVPQRQFNWNGDRRAIDLTTLAKGIYNVRVTNGRSSEVKKLVIE